eukprot:TRINITY_DN12430_c0_g2_i1.p1 TRINITY_DN12430_c0_g2~~TRINITY_DN12430_c0_g2_i1.p1  ORF type:complete len:307 (+),score=64.63 TRINITY_DN12430_c0_g2_i1:109-1029(+)
MPSVKIKYPQIQDEPGQIQGLGILQYIKLRFIHLCYEFKKHKFYSVIFSVLLLILSYLQLFSQLLDTSFLPDSSEEWGPFSFVTVALNLSRLYPYLGDGNSSALTLLFVYLLIALVVLYYAAFYYMHFSLTIRKLYFTMPLELGCIFGELLIWVLLVPVCEVFVDGFRCRSDGVSLLLNDVECNSTVHIIHMVFIAVGLTMYVFAALIIAFYFNDSRSYVTHTGEYGFARLDVNTEVYFCTYRIAVSLTRRWLIEEDLSWVILVFHAIYALPTAYMYYLYVPYLSLIHICRCRRYAVCRSRWSPYH